ncbi:OPT oligopeptide transporter protein-domain-containing protein [Linnemannia elongata]|nr:OPT oligopeptide transporter protein-domain-containing protein [Linnemannia elongata]
MSTERQSEESVDNGQTFEMENEDTIAAVPHFPSEPKDKEEFNEELTRVDTDPGSLEEGQSAEDDLEESIRLVPKIVRELVSMEDDPTLPTLTFRYFVLSTIFAALGAMISQISWFRTTAASFSIFFVQIVSYWLGNFMARALPARNVTLFGTFKFSLNPGPFSIKEHVLITLASSAGASNNLGEIVVAVKDIFYEEHMHPFAALLLMWATIWTGFSFAAIGRSFLLYDPDLIWPSALMQSAMYRTLRGEGGQPLDVSRKQIRVFWFVLIGSFFWTFFPEYIFPFTSSLAVLCWFAPHNDTVKFISSGIGGMGFLNFTLNWSNITSSIMVSPWWTQVISFVAFVVSVWVLVPITHFTTLWSNGIPIPTMSNRLYQANGTKYPFVQLTDSQGEFQQGTFDRLGNVYMSTYKLWGIFFGFATFLSAFVQLFLFSRGKIWSTIQHLRQRRQHSFKDRLNVLMARYEEVPLWWYVSLFMCCSIIMLVIIRIQDLYLPWWTFIVALFLGASAVVPMGFIYAISAYQVTTGTWNELIYGYMAPGTHPVGSLVYRVVAGQCWYRAQSILLDQKIGHYMKVSPRATFFSQIWGTLIGVPVNYAVIRWVIDTKRPYLNGTQRDPLGQWTGQAPRMYLNQGIQYGTVGPTRLFQDTIYSPLRWGFLLGVVTPIIIYLLHRRFPKAKFQLWHSTIFFSSMETFYGNLSTGPLSSIIGGFVCMFYVFRYKHDFWVKYNYLVGAAADTGLSLAILAIFVIFGSSSKVIEMPEWWGNDSESIEKCYGST